MLIWDNIHPQPGTANADTYLAVCIYCGFALVLIVAMLLINRKQK